MTGTVRLFAGVDVGSSATKAAIADSAGRIVSLGATPTGLDFAAAAGRAMEEALVKAGLDWDAIERTVATGYGRGNVPFADHAKTEISCHARGVFQELGGPLTIVDIGGQDTKVISLDAQGNRLGFEMNRKCAAGTGAFVEEMARRLDLPVQEMDEMARQSTRRIELGAFCTVFSSTEVLALARRGERREDIARAVFEAVAKRVTEMDPMEGTVALTGGVVAHNPVLISILEESLHRDVLMPSNPWYTGALGAVFYSLEDNG